MLNDIDKGKYINNLVPDSIIGESGKPRKVGVEIEYSGLDVEKALKIIQGLYGGQVCSLSPFVHQVNNTALGNFKLELDSSKIIKLGEKYGEESLDVGEVHAIDLVGNIAEQVVPWEIVTSPIYFDEIYKLAALINEFRLAGAKGTRYALHHVFGLHLNPELPDNNPSTILNYLRSYVCLYEWIKKRESIDLTRQLSTYIKHYSNSYILKILKPEYQPRLSELIDDYLEENCSRNRSLDLLPLFSWLDKKRVQDKISDERINPRPTFHLRIPNCDIDSKSWNIDLAWGSWLEVEALANNRSKLDRICSEFREDLERMSRVFDDEWTQFLEKEVIYENKDILVARV